MSPEQLSAYKHSLVLSVQTPLYDHRGYRVTGRPADHADEIPGIAE